MNLYLVRHTRVDVPPGVCYGQADVPLAKTFESELEPIRSRLSGIPFERVYCSPLTRCTQLASSLGYPMQLDERLKELNFGRWEELPWDSVFDSETGEKWFADYMNQACPDGESYQDLLQRVESFISDLPPTDGSLLVITHAGIIRAFRVLLKNWTVKRAFDKPVAYGQITILRKASLRHRKK